MLEKHIAKYFLAGLLAAIPLSCFAVRSNDFTKSSNSFSRKYESSNSEAFDKKSAFGDKTFRTKDYSVPHSADGLAEKRSWLTENTAASGLRDKSAPDTDKDFRVPDYKGSTENWRYSDKNASFKNSERDMSKPYEGKIDVSSRNVDKQKFIDEYYSTIVDRSMNEINKYYSKKGDDNEEVGKIIKAGNQLRDDDDGFFDFISRDTKIDRPAVAFKGPENVRSGVREAAERQERESGAAEIKSPAGIAGERTKRVDASANVPKTLTRGTAEASAVRKLKRSNVQAEETIDPETAKRMKFMNVPDDMRAKATIKVEVKDADF